MTKISIVRLSLAALICAALAPAQDSKETPKASPATKPGCCVQQVYQVKHANVRDLYQLLFTRAGQDQTPYLGFNESLKAISVYGTPQEVRSIMANLTALDVPSPASSSKDQTIELTIWTIAASTREEASAPPAALAPSLRALRDTFGYRSFAVLGSDMVRTIPGRFFNTNGNAPQLAPKNPASAVAGYNIRADSVRVEDSGSAKRLRVERFIFRMQATFCSDADCKSTTNSGVMIENSFDLKDGQQVVIGQSRLDGADRSLVLIVSAKVVD